MKLSNQQLAQLEGWMSVLWNTVLFVFKFWVGWVTGSVAVVADAWHTLSDSITSLVVVFGVKASYKPPDDEHPFGHGRSELIASVIIGVLLAVAGFEILWEAIKRIQHHESAAYGMLAVWAMVITIVTKELLAQFSFWAGRKTKMVCLSADGWHHRSDAITSIIILVGIFFGKYAWWIDGALGMLVSLAIIYAAFGILKQAINPLLGRRPDPDLLKKVNNICTECCGKDIEAHHFHIHEYGHHAELTFHIRLNGGTTLEEAHHFSKKIELALHQQLNIDATIHMEPEYKHHNHSE
ncbi:MAG: cation diffusion facilitator family transporter [Victivallaceae bacterium]